MEIRPSQIRYLLVIYELGHQKQDVGTADIAKEMKCSKASVTSMMSTMMDMGYLVKERYGKIYLTDTGFLLARNLLHCVEELEKRIPAMQLELAEEEKNELAKTMLTILPEHCLEQLAKVE